MKWNEKFKVGQRVKVVKKIESWRFNNFSGGYGGGGADWVSGMDKTIGKVFKIINIDTDIGYRLGTKKFTYSPYNYWYPIESLQVSVGEQLLFNFMEN